jgi:DNA-binding transcriptional LysR family regulator
LLPEWLVAGEIREGKLREVLADYRAVREARALFAVYRREAEPPLKVRALIDFLADHFAAPAR